MRKKIKILFLAVLLSAGAVYGQDNDRILEDYLRIAKENNPKLKAAYAEFEAVMQKAPQVSSLPDPTLTMSAFGRMIETRLGAQEARFSLMQMFPWFGTLKAKEDAAVLMAEARFQRFLNMRSSVFLEVKSAYAELYAIREVIRIKRENLEILNTYRELALSRFKAGDAPMVNVIKTDIEIAAAVTEIEVLEKAVKPLEIGFNLLLNRERDLSVQVSDTLLIRKQDIADLKRPFEDHPEIAFLEKQQRSLEMEKEAAKKEGMPMVGLGLDYSIISKRTDANPEGNGQDAIMPMVNVTLPIFRKKYRAAVKEAEFMAESLEHERTSQLNAFAADYEMAAYELQKAEQLIDLYDRQIASSRQANRLLISGFSNATVDFQEILQMNQNLLMFETQKVEALKNGYTAQAKIEYLFSKTE